MTILNERFALDNPLPLRIVNAAGCSIMPRAKRVRDYSPPPELAFDLVKSVEAYTKAADFNERGMIQAFPCDYRDFFDMYRVPQYLYANVERLTAGESFSNEAAYYHLMTPTFDRLNQWPDKILWTRIASAATGKCQRWDDPDDWIEIETFCREFDFRIPDFGTKHKAKVSMRTNSKFKEQIHATAKALGLSASILGQLLVLDGLRSHKGVQYRDEITKTVETFYRKLRKRTMRVACLLRSYEIELCPELEEILEELGV